VSDVPWVVMGPKDNQSQCLRCEHVWDFTNRLPLSVTKWVEATNAFVEAHRDCVERPSSTESPSRP